MHMRRFVSWLVVVLLGLALVPGAAVGKSKPVHPYNEGCRLLSERDYYGAETAFKKAIKLNGKDTDAMNNLAVVYIKQERYLEARDLLERVLKTNPRYRGADLNLGGGYILRRLPDDALPPTTKASKASGSGTAQEVKAGAYHNLGMIAAMKGDLAAAERWFKLALELENTSETQLCLASVVCAAGRPDEGVSALEKISVPSGNSLKPLIVGNLSAAHYDLGMRALGAKDLAAATAEFKKSIDTRANPYAKMALVLVQAERGEYQVAHQQMLAFTQSGNIPVIKSAAKRNASRILEIADAKSRWLKWVGLFLCVAVAGANIFALFKIAAAPRWSVRRPALRAILGLMGAIAATQSLWQWSMSPFRQPAYIALWGVLGLVLAFWVWRGARS